MSRFGHLTDEQGDQKLTKHFKVSEVWCSCCHRLPETDLLFYHMDRLEELRVAVQFPLTVNSGHRCWDHNKAVGGAGNSMHLRIATDVRDTQRQGWCLDRIEEAAKDLKFGGIIRYTSFVHVDSREFVEWKQYWAEG